MYGEGCFCGFKAEVKIIHKCRSDEWISVKDQLPKLDERILAASSDHITFGKFSMYFEESSPRFNADDDCHGWFDFYPTHWMSIPELPEDSE